MSKIISFKFAAKKTKNKQLMSISSRKLLQHDAFIPLSSSRRFWAKFISIKSSIPTLILLFLFFTLLIFSALFYNQSPFKSINKAYALNFELPSSLSPWKNIVLPQSDELNVFQQFAKLHPDAVKISRIIDQKDGLQTFSVSYNAYLLFNDTNIHLLGTNSNGVDIYSRMIYTIGYVCLIAIVSGVVSLTLSTFLASFFAVYLNKQISKTIEKIFTTFALIPYLFISLILFLIFDINVVNAIVIFSSLSSISLFINAYQKSIEILKNEYVNANIATGFSKWDILTKTTLKPVFMSQLIQLVEQINIIFVCYSAISIFDINTTSLTIGTTIKESLNLVGHNHYYLIIQTALISTFVFSLKSISFALNSAYINERGQDA